MNNPFLEVAYAIMDSVVEPRPKPVLLDTQEKVDAANRYVVDGLAYRIGDHCPFDPFGVDE